MRTKGWTIASAAVFLITLSRVVPDRLRAQGGGTALTGTVSSQEEGSMEGVMVTARRDGATSSVSVVSDPQGKYSFPRSYLEPGSYSVTMRAIGYELGMPRAVQVAVDKPAVADLRLEKAADISRQLTSREWALSLPPSPWVDKTVMSIESCIYCHSLERIVKSRHTPEQWVPVITRMLRYYPDGTAAAGTGRGRAVFKEQPGQDAATKSPNWWDYGIDDSGPISKAALGEYLASINLSEGRTTLPFELKALPRTKGKGTRVIITTWDLPRKDTVPHDAEVDSKGNLWYTDESAMFVGRLDPKTGAIREWPLPPVEKGDVPGARDIIVDKQDYPWFAMRVPGSKSVLHKFDPATGQVTPIEGTQGQFLALQPDGSHVWLGFVRVDTRTLKADGDFRRPPNFKDRQASGYGFVVNSLGNPFGTDFRRSEVDGVDVAKNEGGFWPTPTRWVNPRRGRIDAQDRFWFAEYAGERLGMFDTKSHTMQEWKVGPKYSTPYTATVPDANGRVYLPSNSCDCFFRVDTKSGEVIEYPMPGPPGSFDTKKVALDPTTTKPVLLFANTRNAQLMRVEPID